jgi:hypothetical protein
MKDGSSVVPGDEQFGLEKVRNTTEGAWRMFCNICGTSVSYQHESEPGIVEIGAWPLEDIGARAEAWVEGVEKLYMTQDATMRSSVNTFARSLKRE